MSEAAPGLVEVRAGGIRWQVLPECQAHLLGPNGLRLDEWLQKGVAQVIKQGPHRIVYRVALPGLDFYLKHYRLMNARAWLRQCVRPAKAHLEYQRALAVAARQVATITPLGVGVEERGAVPGDSFLMTRSLEDAEPLGRFLEEVLPSFSYARQARLRQELARELGIFLAQIHDAGIIHRDLHAGNVLVKRTAEERFQFYLIDLHDIRLDHPLAWQTRRENLVIFNRWFALRVERTDRLRFWRAYFEKHRGQGSGVRGQRSTFAPCRMLDVGHWTLSCGARTLEERTMRSNLRFWRQREERCLTSNRYYQKLSGLGVAGYAVRELDDAALARLLEDPDAPFREAHAVWLKDSPSSSVIEMELPTDTGTRTVIYKRFRVVQRRDPWLALVRRSPALRSWMYGHALRDRLLPSPRPLVVLHRQRAGLSCEGYLVTEKIPQAVDLERSVCELETTGAADRRNRLRARIDQVARLIRELHERGLSHRDLKAANLLVEQPATSGEALGKVWIIDLAGVRRYGSVSRSRRVQNLARLHVSFHRHPALTRTDKLRFLRVYLQWGIVGKVGWKAWWREIAQATQAKIARNALSGRPLA